MTVDFAQFMEPVARMVWGEPNRALSSPKKLCWGNHGSRVVDVDNGTWYDHEVKEGGGLMDFLAHEKQATNGHQIEWLRAHGFEVEGASHRAPKRRIVATYDYTDSEGELLFQVVRFEPKKFLQRRKPRADDPPEKVKDGWMWSVKGLPLVPYRLPELYEALALERPIFIVEGEKDVDNLRARGLHATCNPMGAGKWPENFPEFFAGAEVIILPDNDDAGRAHADLVAASLKPVAASVRVLEIPDLKPKGDVSDWLSDNGTVEALNALVETRARPWVPGLPASRFGAVWFADIDRWSATVDWLIKGIVTKGSLALQYGPSQSGKSFLAQEMGLAVARNVPFLGRKVAPGGVVYIAAEGKRGFKKRLLAYRKHYGIAPGDPIPFVLIPASVDLFNSDGDTDALIAEIKLHAAAMSVPLVLVVIDTHAAVSPGANENTSEDTTTLISHYERIKEETGATVIIVHHKNAAGERPRGHTSLFAACDTGIEVVRDETGQRSFKIAKQKDDQDGERTAFRLQAVTIGTDDDGDSITSCVVEPAQASGQQPGDSGGKARLTPRGFMALQCLRHALNEHGEEPSALLGLPNGTRIVNVDFWRTLFNERAFIGEDPEPPEETKRKARKRAIDELQNKGYATGSTPYLWLTGRGDKA